MLSPTELSPTELSPTELSSSSVAGSDLPPVEDAAAVADHFIRLNRCFARVKMRFLAAAQHNVEWSSHLLITTLAVEGPMRASALAEHLQADPSTVSRQVATLVKEGLVERRADQDDGRASVLAVTAKGAEVFRDHKRLRNEHYQHMLSGWTGEELQAFAGYLSRFTDRIEDFQPKWLDDAQRTTPYEQEQA